MVLNYSSLFFYKSPFMYYEKRNDIFTKKKKRKKEKKKEREMTFLSHWDTPLFVSLTVTNPCK